MSQKYCVLQQMNTDSVVQDRQIKYMIRESVLGNKNSGMVHFSPFQGEKLLDTFSRLMSANVRNLPQKRPFGVENEHFTRFRPMASIVSCRICQAVFGSRVNHAKNGYVAYEFSD